MPSDRLDLTQLHVLPLAARKTQTRLADVLIDPASPPPPLSPLAAESVGRCAEAIRAARQRGAGVLLLYGAHLIRNGTQRLLTGLMEQGWLTHLGTNGAGSIHDWEFAWLGATSESVRENVATGTFGTWRETGGAINLALLLGGLDNLGYGEALGRFIDDGGGVAPSAVVLRAMAAGADPSRMAGMAELLAAQLHPGLTDEFAHMEYAHRDASLAWQAQRLGVPWTVHPGIGYDIIACHPWYRGGAVGRAAGVDFQRLCATVDTLEGGVVLSVGTAIMGPQVFEKSLSCVNNLRLQVGRPVVSGLDLFVVDLQDGGGWDWRGGEPPKDNPAYYLRFCKSYSRMGGQMTYVQADNAAFMHHLHQQLLSSEQR